MIRYLKHHEINPAFWDTCIHADPISLPYSLYAYLNVVSPNWRAVVFESTQGYKWVFPLPVKKKWGLIPYLSQPLYTQQLGFFGKKLPDADEMQQVFALLQKKYWIIDLVLNSGNTLPLSLKTPIENRVTYLLYLLPKYAVLKNGYNTNRKRVLKKARTIDFNVQIATSAKELLQLFKQSKKEEIISDEAGNLLLQLIGNEKLNHLFTIYYIEEQGEKTAGAVFLSFGKKLIFLFGASNKQGRQSNAMSFLFDYIIQQHAGTEKTLDFEGSMQSGIASFYASFGAKKETFSRIRHNRYALFS